MEATNAIALYVEIINTNLHHLRFHIAPNTVLDWFGLSVRGPAKILDVLRYKVCAQYSHDGFDAPTECNAIEYKPIHMTTKIVPRANDVYHISEKNRIEVSTLKTRADSDVEDDDVEMPNDPPQAAMLTNSSRGPSIDHEFCGVKAKRLKLSDSSTEFSSDEDECPPKTQVEPSGYSHLRYIEATGILNAKPDVCGYASRVGKTRLRISYRLNLADQTPQIALITYYNPERPSWRRRNLGLEFEQMPCDEATALAVEQPALIRSDTGELIVSTVETPTTETIAAALEDAAFRTPTKSSSTTPATLQRHPRSKLRIGRLSLSKSGEKSSAARSLRL